MQTIPEQTVGRGSSSLRHQRRETPLPPLRAQCAPAAQWWRKHMYFSYKYIHSVSPYIFTGPVHVDFGLLIGRVDVDFPVHVAQERRQVTHSLEHQTSLRSHRLWLPNSPRMHAAQIMAREKTDMFVVVYLHTYVLYHTYIRGIQRICFLRRRNQNLRDP